MGARRQLNQARAVATLKARALGFENFFELGAHENFSDQVADGVYLTKIRTETVSRPLP
jgi:hypothetical protein